MDRYNRALYAVTIAENAVLDANRRQSRADLDIAMLALDAARAEVDAAQAAIGEDSVTSDNETLPQKLAEDSVTSDNETLPQKLAGLSGQKKVAIVFIVLAVAVGIYAATKR